jgi:zinc transport system substrate-binding protein
MTRKIHTFRGRWHKCLLLLCAAPLLLASCQKKAETERRTIFVSIEPLRFFAERIADGHFEVSSIVPENYNPESYKPTTKQLVALDGCAAFLKVGQLGFEKTWLENVRKENTGMQIVDTSDSLRIAPTQSFDPHTWTSPENAAAISRCICATLCQLDSLHATLYKNNLEKLLEEIRQTDTEVRKILANIPSRTFITIHPSLTCFAGAYNLTQLSIEKEGKEPTPKELQELIARSREHGPYPILVQKQFSKNQAEIIQKETCARMVSINPLGYNWSEEMKNIAKALADGRK